MVDPELELQLFYSIISLQSTYSVWKYELFPKGHKVGEKITREEEQKSVIEKSRKTWQQKQVKLQKVLTQSIRGISRIAGYICVSCLVIVVPFTKDDLSSHHMPCSSTYMRPKIHLWSPFTQSWWRCIIALFCYSQVIGISETIPQKQNGLVNCVCNSIADSMFSNNHSKNANGLN